MIDAASTTTGEALRQRLLLQAIWRRSPDATLSGWLRDDAAQALRGLQAYRGNGGAMAERALATRAPTLALLMGAQSFGAMARALWQRHPPHGGDLARYGEPLADWVGAEVQLASEPYLADVVRLDAMVQQCESAADASLAAPIPGLSLLAGEDASGVTARFRPGTQVLASRWPVVTIWQAHHGGGPGPASGLAGPLTSSVASADPGADPFAPARRALAQRRAESALVYRDAWRAKVVALTPAELRFTQALQGGLALGVALQAAGAEFSFQAWLVQALQQGWLLALRPGAMR